MQIESRFFAWALTVVSLWGSSTALAEPVRARQPIDVHSRAPKSVVFGQLLIPEDVLGEDVGQLKQKHVQLFNDALREAGYDVPKNLASVFKADELPETAYLLGGTLTEFECSPERNRTCALTIEWELLDRDADEVVYRMTAKHEETELNRLEGDEGAKRLLLGGLRSLLARPKLVEALEGTHTNDAPDEPDPVTIARCSRAALALPKNAKVAIEATALIRSGKNVGSAVFISPDGFLLTAAHVATRDNLKVQLQDDEVLAAEVVRISTQHDVALLRLSDHNRRTPCLVVSTDTPEIGDNVFAIGSPGGEELSFSVSRGIVSGQRELAGTRYMQTDAALNPGNSGGPMLDDEGKVRAIASWKVGGVSGETAIEGLGFGVPGGTALEALNIRLGEASQAIAPAVHRSSVTDHAVIDTADPRWHYVGADAPGRTPGWVGPVRSWGYVSAITGLVMLTSAALPALGGIDEYEAGSTWNQVGWGLSIVGIGMVVSSYVLQSERPLPPESGARVTASVGLDHISVSGTF